MAPQPAFGAQDVRKLKATKVGRPLEKTKKTGQKACQNSHKHTFFHEQSRRWRAVVKIEKDGTRRTKNFKKKKDALAAASEGLRQTLKALKKPLGMNQKRRRASLYEGVFVVSFWAPTGRSKAIIC